MNVLTVTEFYQKRVFDVIAVIITESCGTVWEIFKATNLLEYVCSKNPNSNAILIIR